MKNNKIAIALLLAVIGCAPIVGGVATYEVGTSMADERTVGTIVDDAAITTKIKNEFAQKHVKGLLLQVTVIVKEGRVLLTGSVKDYEHANQASRLAWKVEGVKEVMNEIEVSNKTISERANDSYIAMQVRSKLLFAKDLRSVNYSVDVNKGIVYLAGIAQDKNELDHAVRVASQVNGVKKVVSHVTMRSDYRRVGHR